MKKIKIVLFSPKPMPTTFYSGAPLALLSLVRFLSPDKHDIKIIKATPKFDYISRIIEEAKGALCVGISSMTGYQIEEGLIVASRIKKKFPDIPIIWGGRHPTILPEQTLKDDRVDIVVQGQGERTFAELIECLEQKKNLNGVDGLWYKDGKKIFQNKERKFEDINNFPPLRYDLIEDMEDCIKSTELGSRTINYISSIGCPFRCGFCAEMLVCKRKWYGLKANQVVDEIEMLVKRYSINGIFLLDSNFFVDKRRVEVICKELIRRKIKIKWGRVNGRPDQLVRFDKSLWKLLEQSGLHSILIGAESHSQEMLDIIKKDAKVEDTVRLTKVCNDYNIELVYSLMIGLPKPGGLKASQDYVKEDFEKTISFINQIYKNAKNFSILFFTYTPYAGTPLYNLSVKYGVKPPKNLEGWSKFVFFNQNTPWVSQKYVSLVKQLSMSILPYLPKVRKNKKWYAKILHYLAAFRMKFHFFSFPLEYKMIEFYIEHSDFKKNARDV